MALLCTRANSDMVISNATFAHSIAAGDFTFGIWLRLNTATGFGAVLSTHRNEPWANAFALLPEGVGSSNWGIIIGGSFINFATNLTTGVDYFMVVTRVGTTITGYLQGATDGSTGTSSYSIPNNTLSIGGCSPDNNYHDGYAWDAFVCAAALPASVIKEIYDGRLRAWAKIQPYSPRGYWPLDVPGDESYGDVANGDYGLRDMVGGYHLILHTSPATAPVWAADPAPMYWPTESRSFRVAAAAPSGNLSASISAGAHAAGAIAGAGALAAAVSSSGNAAGAIAGAGALAAAVSGSGNTAAALAGSGALAAAVSAGASPAALLTGAGALATAVSGGAAAAGLLGGTGALTAAAAGSANAAGVALGLSGALAAAISGSAFASGFLTGVGALAASVAGSANVQLGSGQAPGVPTTPGSDVLGDYPSDVTRSGRYEDATLAGAVPSDKQLVGVI